MTRPSQLSLLILDFHREDSQTLQKLNLITQCRVSRWWGVLSIHCTHPEVAEALVELENELKEPIAQLRLAHKIKIEVKGTPVATFNVSTRKKARWMPIPF